MRVTWSQRARSDLVEIRSYIAEDDPGAAAVIASRIEGAANTLEDFPRRGRPGRLPGTRELVVPRTPYVVMYRLREDMVVILRVVHGSQQWPRL